jgi:GAF domain/ANTAR domain
VATRFVEDSREQEEGATGGLCAPFISELAVTGASVSVIVENRRQSTISVSDEIAAEIDELQFVLGEGPHWDALRTGRPVAVADLQSTASDTWPLLFHGLAEFKLGALFAFPLQMGAVTVGVADLYRQQPGPLNSQEVRRGMSLARACAPRALQIATALATDDAPAAGGLAPEMRREVHQATGMILVQLDIDATEAFARLKAHAFASGISIQEVAKDVVQRRLSFKDLPE